MTSPGRSIVAASVHLDGDDAVMEFLCDCGTATTVTAVGAEAGPGTQEFAFTCDGCMTSHWPKLERVEIGPDGSETVAP